MKKTYFERAVFISWYCGKGDCKFCYMSTQKPLISDPKKARRTIESILAEVYLCKKLNWKIEFLSGGYEVYSNDELLFLLKNIKKIYGRVWLNVGVLSEDELKLFKPYVGGVCGAVECVNPRLHTRMCPSKPLGEIENMFKVCDKLNLKKSITIIVGVGETIDDFELLKKFIIKNKIDKITFYRLKPQKGTVFEGREGPSSEYYVKWVKRTRDTFPELKITAGSWLTHLDEIHCLLNAGADSITKFPSIRLFNSKYAEKIGDEVEKAKREFGSKLKGKVAFNESEINKLKINKELKNKIKGKLNDYVKKMNS